MNFIPNYKNSFRILKGGKISLVVSSFLAGTTLTFAAPSGGVVTSGSANISQNGKVTDITQSTQKASINWNKFNIASDETVNFKQPNSSSITLNRVVGNEKSIINGALNANGQVWIINSNGVLFGKGARINTSGLLATTKDISDSDFQAGNYKFTGNSNESVINLGTIDVVNGGSVILAANEVKNEGTIKAIRGKIHLVGADEYTVNLNGNSLVNLIVNKGVLDALVKNSGTIIANGGEVYLTTNAVNELLKGVVNNTGVIEANSLAGITGHVELFAHGGTANVAGTINATDGFVETSGDKVKIADDFKVKADKWLIDPKDFTIAASGGDMTGATLSSNLEDADIEIQSVSGSVKTDGNGDINVNDTISWSSDKKLTLNAQNDIFINKEITASHANGKLELKYGQKAVAAGNTSDYHVNAKVNLKAGENFITKLGSDGATTNWTVVDASNMNSAMNANKTKNYALGADITLSGNNNWTPIGDNTNKFTGNFDGLGHTISNLHINNTLNFQGVFGYTSNSTIKNIGVTNANVTGNQIVGILVGYASNTNIKNSFSSGQVTGTNWDAGGLVGLSNGEIKNSYSLTNVKGTTYVGGLIGRGTSATIINSYASGSVTGNEYVGGLAGVAGTVTNSFYDNESNTATMVDSSNGKTKLEISTALGKAEGNAWVVGGAAAEGYSTDTIALPKLSTFYTSTGKILFAGGMGVDGDAYTITNWNQLQNINNSNILTQGYYFELLNNLGSTTDGYTTQVKDGETLANGGTGWNPIGNASNNFNGTFDGLGFTISNLYINRPTQSYVGLFGYTNNATIKNIGLKDVNITGSLFVGGLVGVNNGTISNSYATGTVSGTGDFVGGLVGVNGGTISNSYATGSVKGNKDVGGLVGWNLGKIENSYATGSVIGNSNVGGLVGNNEYGTISNSFFDKDTTKQTQGVGSDSSAEGVSGKTSAELQSLATFTGAGWNIQGDSTIDKGTPFLAWQKSGNGYTKTWVIGTKGATPPTPNPVDPKPQDTNKGVERIVRSIANQTATTVNLPNMETSTTPNNSGRNTNISFSQGENQMLVSRPIEGQATKRVSLSEARQMQIQNGGSSEEVIVPLSNSSIIQLIDGGVNLPSGVEQEFYLANANTQEGK
ncbi:filamentous hemagglutinin N-terminal domain-containing protein [Aliarcobacter skirrowii]|uniref:two-partner secretion domain-containing protein n=1 Tax=Aliarcobacter skirrowii TaxID=28200 RepID=UPI000F679F06|nr:GLUG motif-containing protein [Aliarcobacter skirrowii]AZL54674.1 filamentous hemagglutinin N-terminal domain-containing protein [Aliarcobacter skirrowii]